MRPINAHIFRTTTRARCEQTNLDVDYPVTGIVVVPGTEIDLNGYIARRTRIIASANLVATTKMIPGRVTKDMKLLLIARAIRQTLGLDPNIVEHDLEHNSTIMSCMACETAALRIMDKKSWRTLQAMIDEMCDDVVSCPDDFPSALEEQLNLLISQR